MDAKGHGKGDLFLKFSGSSNVFGMVETSNFVCCFILESIVIAPREFYSGSRDLFKLLEITDNISETVQDRQIVTMENQ